MKQKIKHKKKIISFVYDTEPLSRMNCKFQILKSFFYQVAPPLDCSIYLRKKSFIPLKFYLVQLLVFTFLNDLNLIFRSSVVWRKITNNLLKIILLWRNYTSFQSYKLHCSDLLTFFGSNDRMRISENHFPWSFVKIIEKKLVNSLTYNFTRRNGKKSFEKGFLEKFPNCENNYLLEHV